jgi:hypothetical protein
MVLPVHRERIDFLPGRIGIGHRRPLFFSRFGVKVNAVEPENPKILPAGCLFTQLSHRLQSWLRGLVSRFSAQ